MGDSKHPLLYEINTRCWLAELSERAGQRLTLADIPESEFDFWQRCGFTHIWLMGVWATGRRAQQWSEENFRGREAEFQCSDIAGSPYAITGYNVSRPLGSQRALRGFHRRLRKRGIKLILDFIPNHTALDHPWAKQRPEYYVTDDAQRPGTIKPCRAATRWFAHGHSGHGEPWWDTLQLDYRNPELRVQMLCELRRLVGQCDGVRCDMAMLQLNDVFERNWRDFPSTCPPIENEFWQETIDSFPRGDDEFLFLAEAYWGLEARLQELGFNFTYDKTLYDRIRARDGVGTVAYLHSLTKEFLARSTHFLENHDEPRIASLLSFEEHRAAALLVMALPGLRLLHDGQLTGARIHANVHFARRGAEARDERVASFYEKLLRVLPQTAVGHGDWTLLDPKPAWTNNPTHANFALVQWQRDAHAFDLAVINLAPHRSQCFAPVHHPDELRLAHWHLRDLLGGEQHERDGADLIQRGLYLDLPPHGAQLFHAERTP